MGTVVPWKDPSSVHGRMGIWEVRHGQRHRAQRGEEADRVHLTSHSFLRLAPELHRKGQVCRPTSPCGGGRSISLQLAVAGGSGCLGCHSHLCPPAPCNCLPALLPHAAPSPLAPMDHALMCADLSWGTLEPGKAEKLTHLESGAGEAGRTDAIFRAIRVFPSLLWLSCNEQLPYLPPELGVPGWVSRVEGGVMKTPPSLKALHL